MEAAEKITSASVPRVALMPQEKVIVEATRRGQGARHSFYEEWTSKYSFRAPKSGIYKLVFDIETLGAFDFDPGECHVVLKAGDEEIWTNVFKWQAYKHATFEAEKKWNAGDKPLVFEIKPLVDKEKKKF